MSDFARFLPLSGRPHAEEDRVSGDRRAALAGLVDHAAELVAGAGEDRDTLIGEFIDDAKLRSEFDDLASEAASPSLGGLAARLRTGPKRGLRALAAGARALLRLARALGADVDLDPGTAGTLSLHLAASAPFDRRAAVKGHTIRASDADWSFGRGPVLEGTATGIAAFLLGTSDTPPRPPAATGRG